MHHQKYQNWQTVFRGRADVSLGGLRSPKSMPGYVPGFMVINDSDYQRVYMHNAAAVLFFYPWFGGIALANLPSALE